MTTDTSERGLERLICTALAGHACDPPATGTIGEPPAGYGGVGWSGGNSHDYDREYCVDLVQLAAFLSATQPAGRRTAGAIRGRSNPTPIPGPAAGGDFQAWALSTCCATASSTGRTT